MCGIVGLLAYGQFDDKKMERLRQEAMIFLGTELLQLTQPRGRDATGAAVMFENCDFMGLKMGVPAMEFTSRYGGLETDFEGFIKVWRKKFSTAPAKVFIGHCRKPSAAVGAGADDNMNNHPIKVGSIMGVHNGTLTNHETIFERLGGKRDGKVDSEAIFRLIHRITNDGGEPFSTEGLVELCKRLNGSYSCLSFSGNNPFQAVGFTDDRPMVFGIVRPLKLLVVASEMDFIKQALFNYNKAAHLYKANHITVKKGDADFQKAADLSTYLFDLREDITPETKINDLIETERVLRVDKIWKPGSIYKKPANQYSRQPTPGQTQGGAAAANAAAKKRAPAAEVNASSPVSGNSRVSQTGGDRRGMAFDRNSGQYSAVGPGKKSEVGGVEVDLENKIVRDSDSGEVVKDGSEKKSSGESASCSVAHDSVVRLTEVATKVDSLVADPAKVVNIAVKTPPNRIDEKNPVIAIHKGGHTTQPGKVTEVDVEIYPDVLEQADSAAKAIESFSNEQEMVEELEIPSLNAARGLELHSLANRIKRFFYRKGFYAGYVAAIKDKQAPGETVARAMMRRHAAKNKSAQATIRSAKTLISILAGLVPKKDLQRRMDASVARALVRGREINFTAVKSIIGKKDRSEFPALGCAADTIQDKEERVRNGKT